MGGTKTARAYNSDAAWMQMVEQFCPFHMYVAVQADSKPGLQEEFHKRFILHLLVARCRMMKNRYANQVRPAI